MYLDLDIVRKHLNLDDCFHDDDEYIIGLSEVAEQMVAADLDANLSEIIADNDGELPQPIRHAMLLLVGNFYMNRESIAFANGTDIPHSYDYLLSRFHNYKNFRG